MSQDIGHAKSGVVMQTWVIQKKYLVNEALLTKILLLQLPVGVPNCSRSIGFVLLALGAHAQRGLRPGKSVGHIPVCQCVSVSVCYQASAVIARFYVKTKIRIALA